MYLATIIGKSCHHGVELFYGDAENIDLYKKDPAFVIEKITKFAKDYAKEEYIAKNKKPEDFWNSKTMCAFWGYTDIENLVRDYTAQAEAIKEIAQLDDVKEAEKELETIWESIKKAIEKHKKKDDKLDDFINWGATGTISKIMEWIEFGMQNWFSQVYPTVAGWKLIGTEYNQTMDVCDLDGEVLDLPLKFIIDAVFEDEKWDIIIVDWKFKSQLSDDESIKPDYDMQGATYFIGALTAFGKRAKKAIFVEIQPSEAKPSIYLQADLRKACDDAGIDWAKWNNGKWMTNPMMQSALLEKNAIELKQVVYNYEIDFTEKKYLIDMWLVFYRQTIKRLFQLLVEEDEFVPNIFDQSFDGGVTVYQEWMAQFRDDIEPEYTDDDAVDL